MHVCREADVIILSCVRSGHKGTLGFIRNQNRLNVALSRAKEIMYVVGNASALQRLGNAAWKSVLRHESIVYIH